LRVAPLHCDGGLAWQRVAPRLVAWRNVVPARHRLPAVLDPPLDEELASLVAGSHQRPCRDEAESERQPLPLEPREHFRAHELLHRQVLLAGAQILAEREDVAIDRPQVAHRLEDFVVRLAEPEHDAALRPHPTALVELEDVERLAVSRAEMARLEGIERPRRAAAHVTEPASARADVAHQHHGRGPTAPALADVGTARLLAHGMEVELAERPLDVLVAAAAWHADFQPFRL